MPENPSITDAVVGKISAQLGTSSETLHKIKFGRGAVGKVAVIAVFAILGIAGVGLRLTGEGALLSIGAILFIVLCVLGVIVFVVIRQPELAVLEGTELVLYKQVTLAAKGSNLNRQLPPVPDPGASPTGEGDNQS
jgi:hypothetical protein